mmetsp:Transcript_6824/g.17114  ORF Transcript_6824/g.17114 Transcript_6824/m.17114 type:complete len:211 (-) Transcript_6824:766-1398(-)
MPEFSNDIGCMEFLRRTTNAAVPATTRYALSTAAPCLQSLSPGLNATGPSAIHSRCLFWTADSLRSAVFMSMRSKMFNFFADCLKSVSVVRVTLSGTGPSKFELKDFWRSKYFRYRGEPFFRIRWRPWNSKVITLTPSFDVATISWVVAFSLSPLKSFSGCNAIGPVQSPECHTAVEALSPSTCVSSSSIDDNSDVFFRSTHVPSQITQR